LKAAPTSTKTTTSRTSIAKTQTARRWRRQRTVQIVHAGLGLVAAVAAGVVPADAVVADAADLAAAVVIAAPVAAEIVALAAVVVINPVAPHWKETKRRSLQAAPFFYVSVLPIRLRDSAGGWIRKILQ